MIQLLRPLFLVICHNVEIRRASRARLVSPLHWFDDVGRVDKCAGSDGEGEDGIAKADRVRLSPLSGRMAFFVALRPMYPQLEEQRMNRTVSPSMARQKDADYRRQESDVKANGKAAAKARAADRVRRLGK